MYPISLLLSSQVFIALRSTMLQNCFAHYPTLTPRLLQAEAEGCEPTVLQLRDMKSRGRTEIWWFGHPDTIFTCGIKIKSYAVSSSRLGCPDSVRIMSSRKEKIRIIQENRRSKQAILDDLTRISHLLSEKEIHPYECSVISPSPWDDLNQIFWFQGW